MNCEFCKKKLKNLSVLNNHKKTAKYCLVIQGSTNDKNKFNCNFCSKIYSQKKDLERHLLNCIEKKIKDAVNEKDMTIQEKDRTIQEKDRIIQEKDLRIKELQDQLVDIIKSRPVTINNNNQRINTIINNLQPITDAHLQEQAQFLTLDHIKQGAEGYAKYALEYPFKDRIVCVDYSRKKIKYKDEDDNIIDDMEMAKLSHKFFKAIETKNTELSVEQINILGEQLMRLNNNPNNDMDEDETEEFQKQSDKIVEGICLYRSSKLDIIDASKGNRPEICNDFIKTICAKVK